MNYSFINSLITSGLETLSTTEKDSWGVEYSSGFQIFRGYYYDNSRSDILGTFEIILIICII
jgi:hypothetical protein